MAPLPHARSVRRRLAAATALGLAILLLGGCGGGGSKSPAAASTAPTESPATIAFLAKAKQLGALGPDDELLLLALDYCGLARRGPIDQAVATNFHGFSQTDRAQASLVLTAAAAELCPDQADALNRAAAQVLALS